MMRLKTLAGAALALALAPVSGAGRGRWSRRALADGPAAGRDAGRRDIHWFHNYLLMPIITVITLFVLACSSM